MTFMEKSAMELLLKCGIHRFPVDAEQIARELDYNLVDYQSGAQLIESAGLDYMYIYEGFSAKIGKKYYIFFKEGLSRERKNWIIAHEIAHIKHHLVSAGLIGRAEGQKEKQLLEQEAETFAKALLASLYVLTHMKIVEPADIERITGLEPDKAQEVFLDLSEYEAERKERLLQNRVSKQFHVKRRHRFPWQVLLPLCICLLAVGIFLLIRARIASPAAAVSGRVVEAAGSLPAGADIPTDGVAASAEIFDGTCFWTTGGEVYHLYRDCQALKISTVSLCSGTAEEAQTIKSRLCRFCERRSQQPGASPLEEGTSAF